MLKQIDINRFEALLEPLVLYLKNPDKIDFDGDILTILTKLIENSKMVTNLIKNIFPNLMKYLQKHVGFTKELYLLLNAIFCYDEDFINQTTILVIINNMLRYALIEGDDVYLGVVQAACLGQIFLYVKINKIKFRNIII